MVLLKISHWGPIIQHCNCFCFSRLFALCGWGMMMIWYHPFHHRLLQNLKLWPKKLEKIHEELFWWKRPNGSFVINSWRRVACSFLHNYTPSDAMHPLTSRSRRMMTNCSFTIFLLNIFEWKHAEDEFCANVLRKILSLKRIPQFHFKDRKGFNNDFNEFTAHSCNHTPTIQSNSLQHIIEIDSTFCLVATIQPQGLFGLCFLNLRTMGKHETTPPTQNQYKRSNHRLWLLKNENGLPLALTVK